MTRAIIVAMLALAVGASTAFAGPFNGVPDNQLDTHGYYYAVSGGLFPTGNTPNGDNASGGTFRYITDDSIWGASLDVWHKDDWYPENAGIGLTLRNGSAIVYDNNGLEPGAATPADPAYYEYTPMFPAVGQGAVVAYSMSNNYDWVYSGYFKLTAETTITQLTGYFAYSGNVNDPLTGPFDPNDPALAYHMNIFSNVAGDLLPANTGSFAGDVFSSDSTGGAFSWSDTGFDRIGSSSQQNIYRLNYTLNDPIVLATGEYWFSHDAGIVPEPTTIGLLALGGLALLHRRRYARN